MTLGELIKYLENCPDQNYVCPLGLGEPHSWRGAYTDLAFTPTENISIAEMLDNAYYALEKEFEGYKGGTYYMDEDTEVHIDRYGTSTPGHEIGPILLDYMTGKYNK